MKLKYMSFRKNPILILLLLLLLFLSKIVISQQTQWPFLNSGQQATVFGTTGEYRATNRFHKGVDMSNGSAVYAITAGPVFGVTPQGDPYNNRVIMGNTRYWHVTPIPAIMAGTKTTAAIGDLIGHFAPISAPHLHLENENFIYLDNHLFPFTDNTQPAFIHTHIPQGATFYQNGLIRITTNYGNTEFTQTEIVQGNYLLHRLVL